MSASWFDWKMFDTLKLIKALKVENPIKIAKAVAVRMNSYRRMWESVYLLA